VSYTSVFKAGECLILGTADGQIVIQVHSKVALTVDAPEEVHTGWMQAPEPAEYNTREKFIEGLRAHINAASEETLLAAFDDEVDP